MGRHRFVTVSLAALGALGLAGVLRPAPLPADAARPRRPSAAPRTRPAPAPTVSTASTASTGSSTASPARVTTTAAAAVAPASTAAVDTRCVCKGDVRDQDGRPVAGARVLVRTLEGAVLAETLSLGDGSYRLLADHSRGGELVAESRDGATETPACLGSPRMCRRVREAGEVSEHTLRLVLAGAGRASGIVRDDQGRPIAGLTLIAGGHDRRHARATTDAVGRFELAGVPIGVRPIAIAGLPGYVDPRPAFVDFSREGGTLLDIEVARTASLALTFPAANVQHHSAGIVRLRRRGDATWITRNFHPQSLAGFAPGEYDVVATANGLAGTARAWLEPGRTAEVTIAPEHTVALRRVRVVEEDGRPAQNVWLSATCEASGVPAWAEVTEEGIAWLGVPAGTCRVECWRGWIRPLVTRIEIPPKGEGRLVLPRRGFLTVIVENATPNVNHELWVHADGAAPVYASSAHPADSRCEIQIEAPLVSQRVYLRVETPTAQAGVWCDLEHGADTAVRLRLDPTVRLLARFELDGVPVRGRLPIDVVSQQASAGARTLSRANDDGTASLALLPGRHRLELAGLEELRRSLGVRRITSRPSDVEVGAGGAAEVVFRLRTER